MLPKRRAVEDKTIPLRTFQSLQTALTNHLRNPTENPYRPKHGLEIEPRRLTIYQDLFYNNLESFFSGLFPVCKQLIGQACWDTLIHEYLANHQAKTPLFHELGQEFLSFLNSEQEISSATRDRLPDYFNELAHYEWVELALSISPKHGIDLSEETQLTAQTQTAETSFSTDWLIQRSDLAWPLSYSWPVADIAPEAEPDAHQQIDNGYTYLVFRNADGKVEFNQLTPLLYDLLISMPESNRPPQVSIQQLLEPLATEDYPINRLATFLTPILSAFVQQGIIRLTPQNT